MQPEEGPVQFLSRGMLRSATPFFGEDTGVCLLGAKPLEFAAAVKNGNASLIAPDGVMWSPVWDYGVAFPLHLPLETSHDELLAKAQERLDDVALLLNFVMGAPVVVYGSPTVTIRQVSSPAKRIIGRERLQEMIVEDKHLNDNGRREFFKLLGSLENKTVGRERIKRSLRWLQNSYLAKNEVDEFVYLMLAFESVSQLLSPPEPLYWKCEKCNKSVTECPNCGVTTARERSGSAAMRQFMKTTLGWSSNQWKRVYGYRSRILHGDIDLTNEQKTEISKFNPDVEVAVIAALKLLLGLPKDLPLPGRVRAEMGDAILNVNYVDP